MTDIILIRHGETAWNAERRLQGHLDISLNDAGLRQAAMLGAALADEPVDAIFSSDLQRALQTAAAVAAGRGLAVQVDAGLRERCFGIFEGMLYADMEAHHPEDFAAWRDRRVDARYPDGSGVAETLREFDRRSNAAVDRIAGSGEYAKIVIVCHGGVLDCLYRRAVGLGLESARDFDVKNASVNRFTWADGRLSLVEWGDVAHLTAAHAAAEVLDEIDR